MQHPTNQNHTTDMQAFPHGQPATAFPFRSSGHRRSHSEVHFRIPVDLDLAADPLDGLTGSSFEDLGSEDDIFCTYMDMEKLGSRPNEGPSNAGEGGGLMQGVEEENSGGRGRHRYSNSVDGCSIAECIEAKKAMAPEKLAELWTIDPRRAKRIIANRQSAARSKERKARYMTDLERKVQTLQTEATTLSAQLTLFQRDTTGLTSENTELKLRLQAMEQQAQLRDALNEALKKEVERLKIATGETMATTDSYDMGIHHIQYNLPPFFHPQPQPRPVDMKNLRMSQYHPLQSKISTPHRPMMVTSNSHAFLEMPHDPIGRLQELDISNSSSLLVKSEGPLISASESSSI